MKVSTSYEVETPRQDNANGDGIPLIPSLFDIPTRQNKRNSPFPRMIVQFLLIVSAMKFVDIETESFVLPDSSFARSTV